MQESYRVVRALPEHVSALPRIERAAAELFRGMVPAALLEHVTPESDFLAAQQDGTLWVALDPDGRPVGFIRVVVTGARVHLSELDVLPEHGRRGVGTALVKAVEDWACSAHFTEITLSTYRDVPWNAPFYAGIGFRVVPESDWDAETRRWFEEEAGLASERARRVVMRKGLATERPGGTMERDQLVRLEDLPNVGPVVARKLRSIDILEPRDLIGRDPYALYDELNARTGARHDPCLLDVLISVTRFVAGEPERPWWAYTAERKEHEGGGSGV